MARKASPAKTNTRKSMGGEVSTVKQASKKRAAKSISLKQSLAQCKAELRKRNQEIAILNSVGEAMAKSLDVKTVTRIVGDKVLDIFHADSVLIMLLDRQTNLIHVPYEFDRNEGGYIDYVEPFPLGTGLSSKVMETRRPLMLGTLEEEVANGAYFPPEIIERGEGFFSESWLGVPIITNDQVLGLVALADARPHAFHENQLQLLQTLSANMGVAIENARLFQAEQQRAAELATVNTVSAALVRELDLSALIELVGEQVRSVFKADIAYVALLDKESSMINFPYQYGQQIESIRLGEGLTSRIIQSGQPLLINEEMDRRRQKMGVHLLGKRARSFLGVPIFLGGEPIGVVSVQSTKQEGLFTENDQHLLNTIAANIGIALQNARLFEETQRLLKETEDRAAELAIINSVQAGLASKLEIQEIYDLVGNKVREIFDANTVTLYTFDLEKNMLYPRYAFEKGRRFNIEPLPISDMWMSFIRQGQPSMINTNLFEFVQRLDPNVKPLAGEMPKSALAVPLTMNREVRGVISLQNVDRENAFTESDMRLLQTLANSMSVALENARLFDETQQRNAELAIINSVQEGLASKLEMQEIYDLVGDKLRDIFHNADVSIIMHDPATNLLHVPYAFEYGKRWTHEPILLPEYGFYAHVLRTGETLVINENVAQAFEKYGGRILSGPTERSGTRGAFRVKVGDLVESDLYIEKSTVRVPLIVGGQARGVISLEDMEREHAFSESDVRLLETLANSMSIALENARLWEQEKLYRKALQRELEIGREIQAGFLPESLPLVEGWEIAALLKSAREVAGDFYDAFELPDGNIGLVIADVCDKGVGAALFMTLFRSLIRVTSNQETFEHDGDANPSYSIAERLKHAMLLTNNYIAETHGQSGMFATLFFGILDPREGRLTYVNGGHEPPLIVQSGNVREALRKTGPAVGVIPGCSFEATETCLKPGDMFFAFTDGAPEAKDPGGEFFGRERLLDLIQRESGSAHELVESIETELHQYIDSATQFDDITLLAVKRATSDLKT